jgi:acyl-coenzyme A synthetase/AMP-(fatty) acid ligase
MLRSDAAVLAPDKVAAHIWFTDEPLPRSATGKLVKREVKARFTQQV